MYEITFKYRDWFYAYQLQRPDLFTALGAVLDRDAAAGVQWYRVRPLVSTDGPWEPASKTADAHAAAGAIAPPRQLTLHRVKF